MKFQLSSQIRIILHWLIPNGGTLLIVFVLLITQNVWARSSNETTSAISSFPGSNATTLSYQGRLMDEQGNPLNGNVDLAFTLYDAPVGGNVVWETESHANVPVSDGLFKVALGSQTPGGISSGIWNSNLYLDITVNGEILSPREPIQIVPDGSITLAKLGEQPYYFSGSFATPSEWMADLVFNGNYARFCEAIGRTFSRAEELQAHYTEPGPAGGTDMGRGNGYFYQDWYYVGSRYADSDVHVYGNSDPADLYNVWQYKGDAGCCGARNGWTYERSAIIWCKP